MIVKIDAKERDTMNKCCVRHDLKHNFYTLEFNPTMIGVEILQEDGKELTAESAFIFGKIFQGELEQSAAIEKIKSML